MKIGFEVEKMQRKMLSKLYIITTFAMFGLSLQPTAFANDVQQLNIVEVNENTKQNQIYLIQYEHKISGQKIVQVYNTEEEYQLRLEEIRDSDSHIDISKNMVRNGNDDMFLTRIEVG